jgi:hypothetical protein
LVTLQPLHVKTESREQLANLALFSVVHVHIEIG